MTNDILTFAASVLEAASPQEAKRRRTDRNPDGVALGVVTIPGAQQVVPQIIAFGQAGGVYRTGRVAVTITGQPIPMGNHLDVGYSVSIDNLAQTDGVARIAYPSDFVRRICLGEWGKVGAGELHMNPKSLLPAVTPDGADGVLIAWPDPPTIRAGRRLFRWLTTTTIKGIRINQSGGEFVVGNPIVGFFLPQLVWG